MPPEYLAFVARVIRDHPARERELAEKEETIIACCHAPTISDMPGGGGTASEPERITEAKERDRSYQRLSRLVKAIKRALRGLTAQEREIVQLLFWEGARRWEAAEVMCLEEKAVWRVKVQVLRKVAPYVIGDW